MRTNNISLLIDGDEYKCRARSVELVPSDDDQTLCTDNQEYQLTATLELTYGATGTYNQLSALAGTLVTIVLKPSDSAAAAGNPQQTFSARMPAIPKVIASPNEIGTFDLVVTSEGGVTEVTA